LYFIPVKSVINTTFSALVCFLQYETNYKEPTEMKRIFFLLFLLIISNKFLNAQVEREMPENNESVEIRLNQNVLYGKFVDQNTNKGIGSASVQLYVIAEDKDSLVRAMLSLPNGDFRFTNLTPGDKYKLVFSAIGYKQYEREIQFDNERSNNINTDLGNITPDADVQVLSGVTVVASKPTLELGVDRKIFNVDKSLTTAGGTAIDIMKNIPTLSVDIDGNVELRKSTPQIFVDGRPTILTLDQIPADNIEKVELITNPSAKYDAASSGGIINIVLKKNKRIGLNGVISVGAGVPELLNSNLNLNLREGKINFFVSGGYNQSGGIAKGKTNRINLENGLPKDYFNQLTSNDRNRKFTSLRFGIDYFIDNRNTLGITQNFTRGKFSNNETQDQEYLNSNKIPEYYGERFSEGNATFNRARTGINFKHNFPEDGKELTADINYNYGPGNENSLINNSFYYPDGSIYEPASIVRNDGSNNNDQVTFQVDYTNPVKEDVKIETGFRSYYNKFSSIYDAFAMDNGQEKKLPLSNNYLYIEKINAAYFTYSGKKNKISYQLGLRAELSDFSGELIDSAFKFGYKYPDGIKNLWNAIFPSAFFSKQLTDDEQLQINYTKRIRRPRFWQINPFIEINDPTNLRQGNPRLRPEFINSFELNYNKEYKNSNLLASVYFRNNPDDITQYSDTISAAEYAELNNAGVDPNAILNTYINANTTNRYGAEFTWQLKFGKNVDITPSLDLQYRTVKAKVKDLDLSNTGFSWETKLLANYKIVTQKQQSFFNDMSFQLSGEYESREVIPQGQRDAQYRVDIAMKKEIFKDKKGSLTFAVNDLFNSDRYGVIYDTETFYQNSYRRWRVRNIRLTFSYKFGDTNFSIFNRGGARSGRDDE
jgi:outer membrane receptor protein involved in Fe transport